MDTSRQKIGLTRVYCLLTSQQIGVCERYRTTFEGEMVEERTIERWINPGDDLSGEEDIVQLIANTYFGTL